jgi:hypothetical protein
LYTPAEVRASPHDSRVKVGIIFVRISSFSSLLYLLSALDFCLHYLRSSHFSSLASPRFAGEYQPALLSACSVLPRSLRDQPPTLGAMMAKPAVLLIGGITHAKKEWQECASFATLKVSAI